MIKNWGSYVVEAVYKLEIHEYIAFVIVMLYIIIAYVMKYQRSEPYKHWGLQSDKSWPDG